MTREAYIIDGVRTAFGKFTGTLSTVRTDDLGAIPIKALIELIEMWQECVLY